MSQKEYKIALSELQRSALLRLEQFRRQYPDLPPSDADIFLRVRQSKYRKEMGQRAAREVETPARSPTSPPAMLLPTADQRGRVVLKSRCRV